jgi:hypothetical protein
MLSLIPFEKLKIYMESKHNTTILFKNRKEAVAVLVL